MQLQNESSCSLNRNRWTKQQLERLRVIYGEQVQQGKKQLWNRITKRVNRQIRNATRQAIEYKWKNYGDAHNKQQNRIHKNDRLIQELIAQLPFKGYSQLTKTSTFNHITQSNLKNIFYSNVRTIAKSISKYILPSIDTREVTSALTNRNFLRFMGERHLHLNHIRNNVMRFRQHLNKQNKDMDSSQFQRITQNYKQNITSDIQKTKSLYQEYKHTLKGSNKKLKEIAITTNKQDQEIDKNEFDEKSTVMISNKDTFSDSNVKEEGIIRLVSFNSIEQLFNDF